MTVYEFQKKQVDFLNKSLREDQRKWGDQDRYKDGGLPCMHPTNSTCSDCTPPDVEEYDVEVEKELCEEVE